MNFLPPEEPVRLYKDGFSDDLLDRKKTGTMLSEVLDRITDPLVVALDGKWGTGKSYFLQRWVGAHREQNEGRALTVYFDAFAHDYQNDPLVALVSVLTARLPSEDNSKAQKIMTAARRLIRPASRIGLALASYGATEACNGLGDAAISAFKGEADKALNEFWSRELGRHAAMEEFHSAIESLTTSDKDDDTTPLVIVVDELDRCRPDYALEVLEVIKHFFAVPHVHFVLGVNLKALENSVRVRYGAGIDATAYLQKFFSFSLSLPDNTSDNWKTPSILKYADNIGKQMGVPNKLHVEINAQLKVLSKNNDISIRQVGKILSATALLPEFARNEKVYPSWRSVLVSLLIAKVIRPDVFQKLVNASISNEEIDEFFNFTKANIAREKNDGSRNPDYEHEIFVLFNIWSFLTNNGQIGDDARERVARSFDEFGDPGDGEEILSKIYNDWMNVFTLPN